LDITLDSEKGEYRFRWTDSSGRRLELAKQVGAALDTIIACKASLSGDEIAYAYMFENLDSSPCDLGAVKIFTGSMGYSRRVPSDGYGWRSLLLYRGEKLYWTWYPIGSETPDGIKRGKRLSGFDIASKGLPTIVECFANAIVPIPVIDDDAPVETVLVPHIRPDDDWAKGMTLGPGPPIQNDHAGRKLICENLLRDLRIAREEGWIGCDEALNEMTLQLTAISEAVRDSKADKLEELVGSLCSLVDRFYSSTPRVVTDEVHSLVTINCRWLLTQHGIS